MFKIPDDMKLVKDLEFDRSMIEILGLRLESSTDEFIIKINCQPVTCTKRNMLSFVARSFDSLGLIAPVTLHVKLLIKRLWSLGLGWDQLPPNEFTKTWNKFQDELDLLNNIRISRHILGFENISLSIVGFCNACRSAYETVFYARTVDTFGQVNVRFLCAQSKIAPMSKVTLPRLELCAVVLLPKLISIYLQIIGIMFLEGTMFLIVHHVDFSQQN